jgi:hypothetical protein
MIHRADTCEVVAHNVTRQAIPNASSDLIFFLGRGLSGVLLLTVLFQLAGDWYFETEEGRGESSRHDGPFPVIRNQKLDNQVIHLFLRKLQPLSVLLLEVHNSSRTGTTGHLILQLKPQENKLFFEGYKHIQAAGQENCHFKITLQKNIASIILYINLHL